MNKLSVIILSAFLLAGCPSPNVIKEPEAKDGISIVYSENLTAVKTELSKLPKADKEQVYKQWAGAAEYLKHGRVQDTWQFDGILGRVQESYSWNTNTYPALTTSVRKFLIEKNYVGKKLETEQDKLWLQGIFDSLADAAKKALE